MQTRDRHALIIKVSVRLREAHSYTPVVEQAVKLQGAVQQIAPQQEVDGESSATATTEQAGEGRQHLLGECTPAKHDVTVIYGITRQNLA